MNLVDYLAKRKRALSPERLQEIYEVFDRLFQGTNEEDFDGFHNPIY